MFKKIAQSAYKFVSEILSMQLLWSAVRKHKWPAPFAEERGVKLLSKMCEC